MKTKTLLFAVVLFACSLISVSAQKLLINENFSTNEWEAEFVRLNPGTAEDGVTLLNPNATNTAAYVTPTATGAAYSNLNSTDIYIGQYNLFGGAIECQANVDNSLTCPNGANHYNADDEGGVSVAWRLKKQTSGDSWLRLPKLPNAGKFSVHVKSAGVGTKMKLQKVDMVDGSEVVTDLTEWNITASGNAKFTTQIDEIKTQWVDSRDSITLRIGQSDAAIFIKIFGFEVEEHASVALKNSIDSATVIQTDNVENIGIGYGQYPQEAYEAFTSAITTATTVHDNLISTRTELLDGLTAMDIAITTFNDSKNITTGFDFSKNDAVKVYGIAGGLKISGADANTQVSIFGLTGNLVKQQIISDEATVYLPTGSYLVKLQNSNRVIKALVR